MILNLEESDMMKSQHGVITARLPSEGLMTQEMRVNTLFGVPVSASAGGPSIDVDRDLNVILAKDGDTTKAQAYTVAHGMLSSGLEHGIFEQIYGKEGISAVKALSIANAQGIPIYQVTAANVNTVLPQLALSSAVKTNITNAVAAGKVVTVSQTEIRLQGWNGVGYIVSDPITGAAGYIISGGLAGGGLAELVFNLLSWLINPSEASAQALREQADFTNRTIEEFVHVFDFFKAALSIFAILRLIPIVTNALLPLSVGGITAIFVNVVVVVMVASFIATVILVFRSLFLTWREENGNQYHARYWRLYRLFSIWRLCNFSAMA